MRTRRAEPKRLNTNAIYSTWWRIWAKPAHQYHTKHATVSDILGFTVFQTVQAYTALRVIVLENERRFFMHFRCYLTDSKFYMQNYIPSVTKFSTTGLAASPGLVRLLSLLQLGRLLYSSARRIKLWRFSTIFLYFVSPDVWCKRTLFFLYIRDPGSQRMQTNRNNYDHHMFRTINKRIIRTKCYK